MAAILTRIGRFFVPAELEVRKRRLELMIWSFLLSLSFYPEYFGFLAWFSLVRPLMIITSLKSREAFGAAYFFSFFFNLFSIYWVAMVTVPGMVSAVIIVAFYYTAILMTFHRVYRFRPVYGFILLPFLWVGMEYFRTLSQFAFPWSDLGYSQSYYLYIIQIVSVVSVHGLSLLIVAVNVLLWQIFRKGVAVENKLTSFFVSAAVVLLLVAYGWIVLPKYPVPGKINVALLQGSVPINVKWTKGNAMHSFELYDSLTQSTSDSALLYIWPETAAPCYLSHDPDCQLYLGDIARRSGASHLVGALGAGMVNGEQRYFNSCFQLEPSGRMTKRYDKVKLVPFSEQVPYQDKLPFLKKKFLRKYLTFIETYDVQWWSDFMPGDSSVLFEVGDYHYAVLICFESTFPEFMREVVRKGADFVVGITNDTWFGRSVGIHMHSRIFLTRAVENRCWCIRVANSGLTYIVDGYGRIRQDLDIYDVAALEGKVNPLDSYSFFTRHGDVAGLASFLITLSIIGILVAAWFIQKILSRKSSRSA
ncbi:MAG: apolipoprotein N-acyltransferase [Candidatus Zixiibacteriota bacterium]|nr:MAG: apolipoprotein N-acyltransferase [candidate division Zixibacteria bacterium]